MDRSKAYSQQQQEETSSATIQKRQFSKNKYKQWILPEPSNFIPWELSFCYSLLVSVYFFFTLKITLKTYNISTKAAYFSPRSHETEQMLQLAVGTICDVANSLIG